MPRFGVALFSLVLVILLSTFTETKSIHNSHSRSKRQTADLKTAEFLAWIALGGRHPPRGCRDIACGVVNVHHRVRRSGADQRIAELQALIALTNNGGLVAHGQFDPLRIGKRNGDDILGDLNLSDRYQLLRSLVQKAAETKA